VYADASDNRVRKSYSDTLATEPPLHQLLQYLHGDTIRRAQPSTRLRAVAGNLGVSHTAFPLFALATCRALESEAATEIPPSALVVATCRALEEEEAMAQTRTRRVDSFSRQQEAQACGGVTARPLQLTHDVHSAYVHTGDPDECKPEYMSPSPAGLVGDVVYGSLDFI
jgi:hypothetical protein